MINSGIKTERIAMETCFCYNKKILKKSVKNKIFKAGMRLLIVLSLLGMILATLILPVMAQEASPVPVVQPGGATDTSNNAGGTTGGRNTRAPLFPLASPETYGGVPAPTQGASAQYQFQELMWGIVQNVRYILGAVAVAFAVYSGFRMVTAWGNEEVYSKQRTNLLYCVIGLAVVGMSGELARIFAVSCPQDVFVAPGQTAYTCTQGGFLKDPNAIVRASTIFNQQTKIIITFIKYFIGAVAVLMIVRNGMNMVTAGGSDDKIAKDKKNLIYSALGLILIIVADNLISNVFYKIDLTRYPSVGGATPGIDTTRGLKEIVGLTNIIVAFVGPIAILMLIAGGIMYITAAGKEETMNKAKRLIMVTIIGIIIIYGAFAIVSTFISGSIGEPTPDTATQNTQSLLNAA